MNLSHNVFGDTAKPWRMWFSESSAFKDTYKVEKEVKRVKKEARESILEAQEWGEEMRSGRSSGVCADSHNTVSRQLVRMNEKAKK